MSHFISHCFAIIGLYKAFMGFPGGSDGKASACNVGNLGLIPGSGRHSQYSCLENSRRLLFVPNA